MSVVESIVARREILAALFEAGEAGLDDDALREKVPQVDDKSFKVAMKRLNDGGPASLKRIYRKNGRWFTWASAPPPPLVVGTVDDTPPPRDPELVAEDAARAAEPPEPEEQMPMPSSENPVRAEVLALLKKTTWFSAPEVADKCSPGAKRALKELVAEKLVKVHGKGRATRYALKAHKLEPLTTTGAAAEKPVRTKRTPRAVAVPRKQRGGGGTASGSSVIKTIAQLEVEVAVAVKRVERLKVAIETLRGLADAA